MKAPTFGAQKGLPKSGKRFVDLEILEAPYRSPSARSPEEALDMEPDIQRRIEETVRKILSESDMDEMTESKVRKLASDELDLNLSKPPYKAFVKQVVESFLEEQGQQNEDQQVEEPRDKEYDEDGNLIICKLSEKRKVTVQDFRGKTLVSIREYYRKDGKELPTSKGISLTEEQWSIFKKNVAAIEKAISKMQEQVA